VDEKAVTAGLTELAEAAGVEVRYEKMSGDIAFYPGGLCKVKGRPVIIINSKASERERMHILARAVKGFDLSDTYIKPAIRELLERV
jgi:hypothetical protein